MIVPSKLFFESNPHQAGATADEGNASFLSFDRFVGSFTVLRDFAQHAAAVNKERKPDFFKAAMHLVNASGEPKFVSKGSLSGGYIVPTADFDFFCSGKLSDVLHHIHTRLRWSWDARSFHFPVTNLVSFHFCDGSIDIHMGNVNTILSMDPAEEARLREILGRGDMSRFHPVVHAYMALQDVTFIPNGVFKSRFIRKCYSEISASPALFQILWLLSGSRHALPTFFLAVIVRIGLWYGQGVVAELLRGGGGEGGAAKARRNPSARKSPISPEARDAIAFDAALQASVALLVRTWGIWYMHRGSRNDDQAHYLRTGVFAPFIGEDGAYSRRFDAEVMSPFFERMRAVPKYGDYFGDVSTFEFLFLKMLSPFQLEKFFRSKFELPVLLSSILGNMDTRSEVPVLRDYAVVGMCASAVSIFSAALAYSALPTFTCIRRMLSSSPRHRVEQMIHLLQLVSTSSCLNAGPHTPDAFPRMMMDPAILLNSGTALMLSPVLEPALKRWPSADALATLRGVLGYYRESNWMFRMIHPIDSRAEGVEHVPMVERVAMEWDRERHYLELSYTPLKEYTAREHCRNLVGRFQGAAVAEIVFGKGWNDEKEIWTLCAQVRLWMEHTSAALTATAVTAKSVATTVVCSDSSSDEGGPIIEEEEEERDQEDDKRKE